MKDPSTETSSEITSDKNHCFKLDGIQSEIQACLKTEEDSDDSCFSVISGKTTYSVHLMPGELFHCPATGIKFQVRVPATIKYGLEYGKEYMTQIVESGYEMIGPLFQVEDPAGAVSEVSLPHYVCLDDLNGEKTPIKCGHFKDGKMTLKKTDKIEPSYIVLKNPKFSCVTALLGRPQFWNLKKKPTPVHGKVLIYFRVVCPERSERKQYRIHLYLIPRDKPQLQKLDEWKSMSGFKRIDKPHQTRAVYTKTCYTVDGKSDSDLDLPDTSLQLTIHEQLENYPFLEINAGGGATEVSLSLAPEDEDDIVWRGKLTKGDLQELTDRCIQKGRSSCIDCFVDKHRKDLIKKVTPVEPVLDGLKEEKLISGEMYEIVRMKSPSQEQMRELYRYTSGWGRRDKEKFYNILQVTNHPVIQELEERDSYS